MRTSNFADKFAAEAFTIAAEMPEIEIRIDPEGSGLIPSFAHVGLDFYDPADDSKQLLMQVRALRAAVLAYHEADTEVNGEHTLKNELKAMLDKSE